MKRIFILCSAAALFCLAACKKETLPPDPVAPTTPAEEKMDYTNRSSFTINGKLYTSNSTDFGGVGNYGTNLKIDTAKENTLSSGNWSAFSNGKYWTGSKDSLQYYRFYTLYIDGGSKIVFSFIKNYNKNQLKRGGALFTPSDNFSVFAPGQYNYALDFERESKQDGIAIKILGGSTINTMATYDTSTIGIQNTFDPGSQANSKFKITKFEKIKNGIYLLEASFEANLFDKDQHPVKLENGSLKLIVSNSPFFN